MRRRGVAVHAPAELAVDVLFGIAHGRAHLGFQEVEVAAWRRGVDTLVQGHHVGRLGAAAAVAGAADALGVDLGPRLQVVDAAHAIPDLEGGRVSAEQHTPDADHGVSLGPPKRRFAIIIEKLGAFPLVYRVEDQRRHAV